MELTFIFASVIVIWSIAAVIPGPNFFITIHYAIEISRRSAMIVVLGISTGTVFWAASGYLGINFLFQSAPWLYFGLKIMGGSYLVYLGVKLFRSSSQTRTENNRIEKDTGHYFKCYRLGLLTNLSNPKTAAFSASLFAATLPAEPSPAIGLICVALMTLISLCWYSSVAFVFSTERFSHAYRQKRALIERIAGAVFVILGTRLAFG